MIFNLHPDWLTHFKACWKRAESFANKDSIIDPKHQLYVLWENTKFFINPTPYNNHLYYIPYQHFNYLKANFYKCGSYKVPYIKRYTYKSVSDIQYDMSLLNNVAVKIDDYLVNHMLKDDESLHRILYEWKSLMPIDPTKLE